MDVGYINIERESKYSVGGNCFVVPGGQNWNLKDLKIVDGDYDNDYIQFVQTGNAVVDRKKSYYYDPDLEQWLYLFNDEGKQDQPVEDENCVIPAGTAVLCVFNTSDVKLTYAGEVQKGVGGEIAVGRVGKYQFIANQLPYDVNICDLVIADGDFDNDYIQFVQKGVAVVDRIKSFYYDSDGNYMCYLFNDGGKQDEEVLREDGMILKAGEGVLAVFNSTKAKLVFKAPAL